MLKQTQVVSLLAEFSNHFWPNLAPDVNQVPRKIPFLESGHKKYISA